MIFVLECPPYLKDACFLVGVDKAEFERWYYDNVTKMTLQEHDEILEEILDENSCAGFTRKLSSQAYLVYLRKGFENKELYVTHEMYHLVNMVLTEAGVEHDIHDEPYTYSLGWMVNEYYNKMDEIREEEGKDETV